MRVATHILAFEGDSRAVWFEGNYQDYEADRKRRLGAQADQPHRIKFYGSSQGLDEERRKKNEARNRIPPGAVMTPEHAHFLAQTVGQNLQREWILSPTR